MPRKISFVALCILSLLIFSFAPHHAETITAEIRFTQLVNGTKLEFDKNYTNKSGQQYFISKLMYYVSNIRLQAKDGYEFADNGYYLVDASNDSTAKILLKNIPVRDYVSVSFIVGVDSAKSTEQALQEGALDPMNGMYWTWNTGYIFFKLEGKSPASKETNHELTYHIGGYKKPANCIRAVKLALHEKNIAQGITIAFDAASFINAMNLSEIPSVTTHLNAERLADSYQKAFSLIK
jgi:hypothetical protein